MSSSPWKTPSVLLVTVPPSFDVATLKATTAEAIVVRALEGDVPVEALATARPDLPLVVLDDADEARTIALIAQGADSVLPARAAMHEIAQAVRMAVARRAHVGRRRQALPRVSSAFGDAPQLQAI